MTLSYEVSSAIWVQRKFEPDLTADQITNVDFEVEADWRGTYWGMETQVMCTYSTPGVKGLTHNVSQTLDDMHRWSLSLITKEILEIASSDVEETTHNSE